MKKCSAVHLHFLPTTWIPYFILFFYTSECAIGLARVFPLDDQRMEKFKIPKPPVQVLESKACKPACTGKWGSGHTSGVVIQPAHIHRMQETAEEHAPCRGSRWEPKVMKAQERGTQGVGAQDKAIWLHGPLPHSRGSHSGLSSSFPCPSKYSQTQLVTSYIQWTLNLRVFQG